MPTSAQRRVIDPILSNVVRGYRHPDHVGMALFPRVFTRVSGGKIIEFGKDSFRLYRTARAPGTVTKRVQFGYQGKPYALENHALEAPVPREHLREAEAVPGIDLGTRATTLVMKTNSLILEEQQASIATNAANYGSGNKVTLSGSDQWNDYANSKPLADIETGREAIRSRIGVYPNVLELSAAVFASLKQHPEITDKIKYTRKAIVTADLLAALLGFEKAVIGGAVYADDDDNFVDAWGKHAVLAYAPTAPSGMEEPSYGYTYTMEDHPLVEQAYWEETTKSWIYGVHYERAPVPSGMDAGYLIQNAVA